MIIGLSHPLVPSVTLLLLLLAEFDVWCHWSFCATVITSNVLMVKPIHYSYIIILVKNTLIS